MVCPPSPLTAPHSAVPHRCLTGIPQASHRHPTVIPQASHRHPTGIPQASHRHPTGPSQALTGPRLAWVLIGSVYSMAHHQAHDSPGVVARVARTIPLVLGVDRMRIMGRDDRMRSLQCHVAIVAPPAHPFTLADSPSSPWSGVLLLLGPVKLQGMLIFSGAAPSGCMLHARALPFTQHKCS